MTCLTCSAAARPASWVALVLVILAASGCAGASGSRGTITPEASPESAVLTVLTTRQAMPEVVARGFGGPGEVRLIYAADEFDLGRRLEAGAHPDLIVVRTDGAVAPDIIADAVRPIDAGRIAGWSGIESGYRSLVGPEGGVYLVPVVSEHLGLIVREGKPDHARSYSDLFAASSRGRLELPDNAAVAFQAAAMALGFDAGQALGARASERVRILLKGQRRWLRAAWRDPALAGRSFARGEIDVTLGTQADLRRMERFGVSLRMVVPREGTLVSFVGVAIGRNAAHPDAAYAFISYLLRPRTQVAMALGTRALPVCTAAASLATPGAAARLRSAPVGRVVLLEPELAHTDWIQTWYAVKTGLACCL
jgi:spermidine/putrescine-binding protein